MNEWNDTDVDRAQPYKARLHEDDPDRTLGSCFLYGCLISFVLVLILVVGGGLTGYWFLKKQVSQYTSDKPADLPVVEYSKEDIEALENRVKEFKQDVEQGDAPEALVLTADEINALISKEGELNGKVYVAINEGQVTGEVSIPTDFIPGGQDRYFNASATLDVSLENGVLIVTLVDATVMGEKVPQEIIEGIGKENLAKDLYEDPEVAEILRRFDNLTIEEDKIILTPKLKSDNADQTQPEVDEGSSSDDVPAETEDFPPRVMNDDETSPD